MALTSQPVAVSPGKISFLTSHTHTHTQTNIKAVQANSLLFWLIQKGTRIFSEETPECVQLYEIPLTRAQGTFFWG